MLGYLGHVLLDNRHGLVANTCVTPATGTAEREAALGLTAVCSIGRSWSAPTKRTMSPTNVETSRAFGAIPRVAQKIQGSAIDGRTTRHPDDAISQQKRKLVEQVFGWNKRWA